MGLPVMFLVALGVIFATQRPAQAASATLSDSSRIINGQGTNIINFPYIISLLYRSTHICGGSIVNERTIVTAAHCLVKENTTELLDSKILTVHAGTSTQCLREGELHAVKLTFINPNYVGISPWKGYDIGIVRLVDSLSFGPTIQPIQLANVGESVPDNSDAWTAGWGHLTEDPKAPTPYYLQYTTVQILNSKECANFFPVWDTTICAMAMKYGGRVYIGDSGGPLVVNNKLVGIVSGGIAGTTVQRFAHVAKLRPWLDDILEKYDQERV